jgi:hypothetical protein
MAKEVSQDGPESDLVVVNTQDTANHVLVNIYAKRQADLLGNPRAAPAGFRCFISTMAEMSSCTVPLARIDGELWERTVCGTSVSPKHHADAAGWMVSGQLQNGGDECDAQTERRSLR